MTETIPHDLLYRLAINELRESPKASAFKHWDVRLHGNRLEIATVLIGSTVRREQFWMCATSRGVNVYVVPATFCGCCGGDLAGPISDRADCNVCDQEARERGEAARVDAAVDVMEAAQ